MKHVLRKAFIVAAVSLTIAIAGRATPAKDTWIEVHSKNFFLIGNASDKDIRKVATRLEQFRETFRNLFSGLKVTSPIPTNVVVFKNDSSYREFKPKRADGKIDNFIAGYFQPGEDVNYITLSTGGPDQETYGTIFHEYVHFVIETNFGKSDVPPWFNEGLAEYYQTFEILEDQKVKLGLPQSNHLNLLSRSRLMPLDTLFNVTNFQLHQTADHSRSIFYAQAWALIHYLTQSNKTQAMGAFLKLVTSGVEPRKAFLEAFNTSYEKMETDLERYVAKSTFNYHQITFKEKLTFDADMRTAPMTEAASNAFLGDLLYHTNRHNDAEPLLTEALRLDPTSTMANTTLGMVKMKQLKFDEARPLLEKAVSGDSTSYIAQYRYAYLLSRDGRDEFGYVQKFDPVTAGKMRSALKKAIALSPEFTESYELLAFLSLVNNEELDEALTLLRKALTYQPGNERYLLRIGEILSRQVKLDESNKIAEKLARSTASIEVKQRAESLITSNANRKAFEDRQAAEKKRYENAVAASNSGGPPALRRIEGVARPSEEEIAREQRDATIRSINQALRPVADGEQRTIGRISKIDCKTRPIGFMVKTATESFLITSADFNSLLLNAFEGAAANVEVGCDANIAAIDAVITYKNAPSAKNKSRGDLLSVEFVPGNFRFMTPDEMSGATLVVYDDAETTAKKNSVGEPLPTVLETSELDASRREAVMGAIRKQLRPAGAGEKREIGFLDTIECGQKGSYFIVRTGATTLRLLTAAGRPPRITVFTPDLSGFSFGCGIRPIDFPVVVIYTDKPDSKAKSSGEIVSLDFVPKSFTLSP